MTKFNAYARWAFGLTSVVVGSISLAGVPGLPPWLLAVAAIAGPVLVAVDSYIRANPFPSSTE